MAKFCVLLLVYFFSPPFLPLLVSFIPLALLLIAQFSVLTQSVYVCRANPQHPWCFFQGSAEVAISQLHSKLNGSSQEIFSDGWSKQNGKENKIGYFNQNTVIFNAIVLLMGKRSSATMEPPLLLVLQLTYVLFGAIQMHISLNSPKVGMICLAKT